MGRLIIREIIGLLEIKLLNQHGGRDRVYKISKRKEVLKMKGISLDDILSSYDEWLQTVNSGC